MELVVVPGRRIISRVEWQKKHVSDTILETAVMKKNFAKEIIHSNFFWPIKLEGNSHGNRVLRRSARTWWSTLHFLQDGRVPWTHGPCPQHALCSARKYRAAFGLGRYLVPGVSTDFRCASTCVCLCVPVCACMCMYLDCVTVCACMYLPVCALLVYNACVCLYVHCSCTMPVCIACVCMHVPACICTASVQCLCALPVCVHACMCVCV